MTDELVYGGRVSESGELKIGNRAAMLEDIRQFAGKEVEIVVRKKKKVRSLALNKYYWAEVIPKVQMGMKELGERMTLSGTDLWLRQYFASTTKEQAHEFLKDRFLDTEEVDKETGDVRQVRPSTARMKTADFQDYIAAIVQFAAETLGVQIMMPNEQSEMKFNNSI